MPPRKPKMSYLECRTFSHAWDDVSGIRPRHTVTYLDGRRITFQCTRCETVREDIWSTADGHLVARVYYYPDDYKYVGDEPYSKDDLRLAYIKSMSRPARQTSAAS